MVNRKEMARRIAYREGYNIGDIERVLEVYEDIVVEALENKEEVKQGKLFKIFFKTMPRKNAWDGLNKRTFIRPKKDIPYFKPLTRIKNIEFIQDEETE